MTIKNEFARILRQRRGEMGLSQIDLANMIGIAPAQLSRYETGNAFPRPELVAKIATALELDAQELTLPERSTISLNLTADLYRIISLEAEAFDMPVEDVVLTRLVTSYMDPPTSNDVVEELNALRAIVLAFEATSDDFEKEMGARVAKHVGTLIRRGKAQKNTVDNADDEEIVEKAITESDAVAAPLRLQRRLRFREKSTDQPAIVDPTVLIRNLVSTPDSSLTRRPVVRRTRPKAKE